MHTTMVSGSGQRTTNQMITFTSSGFIHKSTGQTLLLGRNSVYIAAK